MLHIAWLYVNCLFEEIITALSMLRCAPKDREKVVILCVFRQALIEKHKKKKKT